MHTLRTAPVLLLAASFPLSALAQATDDTTADACDAFRTTLTDLHGSLEDETSHVDWTIAALARRRTIQSGEHTPRIPTSDGRPLGRDLPDALLDALVEFGGTQLQALSCDRDVCLLTVDTAHTFLGVQLPEDDPMLWQQALIDHQVGPILVTEERSVNTRLDGVPYRWNLVTYAIGRSRRAESVDPAELQEKMDLQATRALGRITPDELGIRPPKSPYPATSPIPPGGCSGTKRLLTKIDRLGEQAWTLMDALKAEQARVQLAEQEPIPWFMSPDASFEREGVARLTHTHLSTEQGDFRMRALDCIELPCIATVTVQSRPGEPVDAQLATLADSLTDEEYTNATVVTGVSPEEDDLEGPTWGWMVMAMTPDLPAVTKARVQARIDAIVARWKPVFDKEHPAVSADEPESLVRRED